MEHVREMPVMGVEPVQENVLYIFESSIPSEAEMGI